MRGGDPKNLPNTKNSIKLQVIFQYLYFNYKDMCECQKVFELFGLTFDFMMWVTAILSLKVGSIHLAVT